MDHQDKQTLKQTPVLVLTIMKDPQTKALVVKKQFGREVSAAKEQKKAAQAKETIRLKDCVQQLRKVEDDLIAEKTKNEILEKQLAECQAKLDKK